jgi:hypothetical protein
MACPRANIDLTICENADSSRSFIWKTGATVATAVGVDLTDYTAAMQIRSKQDWTVLVEKTSEDGGITFADQEETPGKYTLNFTAEETAGLCPDHQNIAAKYDLYLIAPGDGARRMHQYGDATIVAAVTEIEVEEEDD